MTVDIYILSSDAGSVEEILMFENTASFLRRVW